MRAIIEQEIERLKLLEKEEERRNSSPLIMSDKQVKIRALIAQAEEFLIRGGFSDDPTQ